MKEYIQNNDTSKDAIVVPWHNTKLDIVKSDEKIDYPLQVMTSGNLVNLDIYQKIGKYNEDFFIDGIDIEFVDAIDGRRKYCQCKAGPKTINKDDIATILGHFKYLMNKSRLDRMGLQFDDLVVGVLYGEKGSLSAFYKAIDAHYPVLCGSDFWMHLTGDETFYHRLAKAFGEVVDEDGIDGSALILAKVEEIAEEIIQKGGL